MTPGDSFGDAQASASREYTPFAVYVLGLGIFSMVTSELQVTAMMPMMAEDLRVSISEIGYLISSYALAMAIGGPLLAALLLGRPRKIALMTLFAIFLLGEALGAVAWSYWILDIARLATGAVSGAFFGLALTICVEIAPGDQRGRATSIVLAGLMVGTVLGLPVANLIGTRLGWRESFWTVCALSLFAASLSALFVPDSRAKETVSVASEIDQLKRPKLWAVYATSLLIIGATYAAFSYFTPILHDLSGFSDVEITILLCIYGLATLIGNTIVGRLADRYTIQTLTFGLVGLVTFLPTFALLGENKAVAALSLIGIGLVGVTMNPAMVSRVIQTANGRPLVNTVHTSVITLGVVIGASISGLFISNGFGLTAPLWVGLALAVLGLVSLIPDIRAIMIAGDCRTSSECRKDGDKNG